VRLPSLGEGRGFYFVAALGVNRLRQPRIPSVRSPRWLSDFRPSFRRGARLLLRNPAWCQLSSTPISFPAFRSRAAEAAPGVAVK
jgi:hypothetical protein